MDCFFFGNKGVVVTLLLVIITVAAAEETPSSTESSSPPVEFNAGENFVTSKSLNLEENKIEGKSNKKRNPKFGFIPFPMPGMGDPNSPTPSPDTHIFGGGDASGSTTATLGTTAVLIKGGILSGLMALKAAILPPLFLGALILFLMAGAAFFTCSVVNCGRLVGDVVGPGGSPFGGFSPFSRHGFEEYDHHHRPIYQTIDEGYQKFNS